MLLKFPSGNFKKDSVLCVAPTRSSRRETTDVVLGYFLPDPDQGITELPGGRRCLLAAAEDGPEPPTPQVVHVI